MRSHSQSHSRAQASIETLLVFLIFLSAFGIVYAASSRLATGAQTRLDMSLSQASFLDFAAKLQSACSLGNGNVREVDVKGNAAALSADGKNITFSTGDFTSSASSPCEISFVTSAPSHHFIIENKNSTLEIN